MTDTLAVNIIGNREHEPINFRISHSSFLTDTSDKDIKVINIGGEPQVSWMLWKTDFQINSYHMKSSDKNFPHNLNKIVSYGPRKTLPGTISENQYASGKALNRFLLLECFSIFICEFNVNLDTQRTQTLLETNCDTRGMCSDIT